MGHLWKVPPREEWIPMACRFWDITGIEPFSIDQVVTVEFEPDRTSTWQSLAEEQHSRLEALGGTASFLVDDSPIPRPGVDAVLLSTENALE
jgi:hypothetical protein